MVPNSHLEVERIDPADPALWSYLSSWGSYRVSAMGADDGRSDALGYDRTGKRRKLTERYIAGLCTPSHGLNIFA